ncbi:hypothetical protein SAMN06269117_11362 [Balnearium lithotrophicum]|uniref:Uncharacterized protein n=1 Tax=Balnearium lithotrophicum TaxID=223788 RepID=A0A521CK38_9BACT|nr:hypothetical protein [Balnearium lithotrophicum]SMO59806.1 hypothetical protein SAMN06269117_11362 [Balnearium lithotrophicum]
MPTEIEKRVLNRTAGMTITMKAPDVIALQEFFKKELKTKQSVFFRELLSSKEFDEFCRKEYGKSWREFYKRRFGKEFGEE